MRKLVLILIAFIAVITFIRAYDNSDRVFPEDPRINATVPATVE